MKKKTGIILLLILLVAGALVGLKACSEKSRAEEEKAKAEKAFTEEPSLGQIRHICELATVKCQYHNIAKSIKTPGKGFWNIGKKERKFWIEYEGTVEVSYDADRIEMRLEGDAVHITLPEPDLHTAILPDSWSPDSYYISKDNLFFQKNPITAEDQEQAVANAQRTMENQVRKTSTILQTAETQAMELIENYIHQIGEITGRSWTIFWEKPDKKAVQSSPESTSESFANSSVNKNTGQKAESSNFQG